MGEILNVVYIFSYPCINTTMKIYWIFSYISTKVHVRNGQSIIILLNIADLYYVIQSYKNNVFRKNILESSNYILLI